MMIVPLKRENELLFSNRKEGEGVVGNPTNSITTTNHNNNNDISRRSVCGRAVIGG
jgi:hypothetical protein